MHITRPQCGETWHAWTDAPLASRPHAPWLGLPGLAAVGSAVAGGPPDRRPAHARDARPRPPRLGAALPRLRHDGRLPAGRHPALLQGGEVAALLRGGDDARHRRHGPAAPALLLTRGAGPTPLDRSAGFRDEALAGDGGRPALTAA